MTDDSKTPEDLAEVYNKGFEYIKELLATPLDMAMISADYYQGFMHGVSAVGMFGNMAEEGDNLGEFLIRKWLNIKDERK